MNTWCEHMIMGMDLRKVMFAKDDWQFCPVCGAKRPEPPKPKKLGEIYNDAYYFCSTPLPSEGTKYGLQAVVDAICERIEKVSFLEQDSRSSCLIKKDFLEYRKDIIQELKGML